MSSSCNRRWTILCASAAVAVLFLGACSGFAQEKKKKGASPTRSVQGTVTHANDTAADGAVVYLENTKSMQIRSFITPANGTYYFNDLSPDIDYKLRAEFSGTASITRTLSSFDTRKEAIINLKLNPKK